MANKVIQIDFDNVICATGKWSEGTITASPMPGAKDKIIDLMEQGYECVVFTARRELESVNTWMKENDFPDLVITNQKLPARAYIDDRAIRFTNWDDMARYFL